MKLPKVRENDLINLCTLDNTTPLVFLALYLALQPVPSVDQTRQQQKSFSSENRSAAANKLMEEFSVKTKDQNQILVAFDMIARRHNLQNFDHLQYLVRRCSAHIRKQILHLACRHDNAPFLKWLISQEELREHLNTADYAGYTPLLTATFHNSENCVKELVSVCFHLLLYLH